MRVFLDLLHEFTNTIVLWLVWQQNMAIRIFWSQCQPRLTLIARDLHHGKQRVSEFYHDLSYLQNWSSCCHERNVFGEAPCSWLVSRQTTGFTVLSCFTASISWERDVPSEQTTGLSVLSWFGFGFGWVDWELFACRSTSPSGCRAPTEPNSFIQSYFKEIFGGGRSDAILSPPVSVRTTFGIQKAGRVSWRMVAVKRVW